MQPGQDPYHGHHPPGPRDPYLGEPADPWASDADTTPGGRGFPATPDEPWTPSGGELSYPPPGGGYGSPVTPPPPPYPSPYPPPGHTGTHPTGFGPPPSGNGMGTSGLVLGIVALVTAWCPAIGLPTGITAVALGGIAMSRARQGRAANWGQGLAGVICGAAGTVITVVWTILIFGTDLFDQP